MLLNTRKTRSNGFLVFLYYKAQNIEEEKKAEIFQFFLYFYKFYDFFQFCRQIACMMKELPSVKSVRKLAREIWDTGTC